MRIETGAVHTHMEHPGSAALPPIFSVPGRLMIRPFANVYISSPTASILSMAAAYRNCVCFPSDTCTLATSRAVLEPEAVFAVTALLYRQRSARTRSSFHAL